MSKGRLVEERERKIYGNFVPRLVIQTQERIYQLLKPSQDYPNPLSRTNWNQIGKNFSEKGITSLYKFQEREGIKLYFFPPTLELNFRAQPSQLEQTASAQPL